MFVAIGFAAKLQGELLKNQTRIKVRSHKHRSAKVELEHAPPSHKIVPLHWPLWTKRTKRLDWDVGRKPVSKQTALQQDNEEVHWEIREHNWECVAAVREIKSHVGDYFKPAWNHTSTI